MSELVGLTLQVEDVVGLRVVVTDVVGLALPLGVIVIVGVGRKRQHWPAFMGAGMQSHSVTTRISLLPVSEMKMWQLKS